MPAHGILVLDKPAGITSRRAVNQVSKLLAEKKAGHLGTLDPMATGVLPILLGQATRLAPYLEAGEKEYRAVIRLGIETDTWDAEGQVVATADVSGLDPAAVVAALSSFQGEFLQVPPMHSAIKKHGAPLYRLAHQGKEIPREPRKVKIISLEIVSLALPDLTLRLRCGPGFYVRSLAHDLGLTLSVPAHLSSLARLASGHFTIADAVPLDGLSSEQAHEKLIPPALCLPHLPALDISDEQATFIIQGRKISFPLPDDSPDLYQIHRLLLHDNLLALAKIEKTDDRLLLQPVRVLRDES